MDAPVTRPGLKPLVLVIHRDVMVCKIYIRVPRQSLLLAIRREAANRHNCASWEWVAVSPEYRACAALENKSYLITIAFHTHNSLYVVKASNPTPFD